MFNSCFGVRMRLRGQKRVPRPPARITAWTVSLSVGMTVFLCILTWIARRGYEHPRFFLRIEAMASNHRGNKPAFPPFVMKITEIASGHVVWIARPANHSFAFQKYP